MRSWLSRIADTLERFQLFICWILLCIMVVVVFSQVLGRYLFHFNLLWGPEVAIFCLVWTTLLGAAVAVRRKTHYVFEILPPKSRFVTTISGTGILVTALIMVIFGFRFAIFQGTRITQPSEFRLIWYFLAFPAAGASMIIYLADLLVKEFGNE